MELFIMNDTEREVFREICRLSRQVSADRCSRFFGVVYGHFRVEDVFSAVNDDGEVYIDADERVE